MATRGGGGGCRSVFVREGGGGGGVKDRLQTLRTHKEKGRQTTRPVVYGVTLELNQ